MLLTLVLLAGTLSITRAAAGPELPANPLDRAAIANGGSGVGRAVLTAKPGAELERSRSHSGARHWGLALVAALALIALALRPSSFQRLPVVVARLRTEASRVRQSRAPPRLLLIQS